MEKREPLPLTSDGNPFCHSARLHIWALLYGKCEWMLMGKTVSIHCKYIVFPQVYQNTTKKILDSSVLSLLILLGQLPLSRDPISSNAQYTNLLFPFL